MSRSAGLTPDGPVRRPPIEAILWIALAVSVIGLGGGAMAQPASSGMNADNPLTLIRMGQDQKKAIRVGESIYQAIGFSNTFMVVTPAGNVIIDTSLPFNAARHRQLLRAESAGPIRYIILTHAHGDHIGGVAAWKEAGTQIVAQRQHAEFRHYEVRLGEFFARRNAAQFGLAIPSPGPSPGNYGAKIEPTILFDEKYTFELGGLTFEVLSTPGETPDQATVWIPQLRAAFVGDNFYQSFPNLYTLRGTEPRPALAYVRSIEKVLALRPEIVLPSHGDPIQGAAEITRQLTKYRDAILYVHDETVKGMNAGKDVWQLMREVRLPAELEVGEAYGKLSWSVRGIYEGYVGWFDLDPATIYELPARTVYPEVVRLAGGPEAIAALAAQRNTAGEPVEALHLTAMALAAAPGHSGALQARLRALEILRERCRNTNERGWLEFAIRQTRQALGPATRR
jgi:alkyl sulfatase BDS1-like metallo-beta-lactamase superfamily hydrolase